MIGYDDSYGILEIYIFIDVLRDSSTGICTNSPPFQELLFSTGVESRTTRLRYSCTHSQDQLTNNLTNPTIGYEILDTY